MSETPDQALAQPAYFQLRYRLAANAAHEYLSTEGHGALRKEAVEQATIVLDDIDRALALERAVPSTKERKRISARALRQGIAMRRQPTREATGPGAGPQFAKREPVLDRSVREFLMSTVEPCAALLAAGLSLAGDWERYANRVSFEDSTLSARARYNSACFFSALWDAAQERAMLDAIRAWKRVGGLEDRHRIADRAVSELDFALAKADGREGRALAAWAMHDPSLAPLANDPKWRPRMEQVISQYGDTHREPAGSVLQRLRAIGPDLAGSLTAEGISEPGELFRRLDEPSAVERLPGDLHLLPYTRERVANAIELMLLLNETPEIINLLDAAGIRSRRALADSSPQQVEAALREAADEPATIPSPAKIEGWIVRARGG